MTPVQLPIPPERLRILVGPFSDAELFVRSGDETATEIVALCGLAPTNRRAQRSFHEARPSRGGRSYPRPSLSLYPSPMMTGKAGGLPPAVVRWPTAANIEHNVILRLRTRGSTARERRPPSLAP